MKKKTVALLLSLVLVFGVIAGGTLAWLTAQSDTVVNTFTTSDINVKLAESKGVTTADGKSFKMVPGKSIEKDPKAWGCGWFRGLLLVCEAGLGEQRE